MLKNNVKKGHKVPENFDLNELNEHLTVEIPLSARVYPRGALMSTCDSNSYCCHVC